ncbi:MAG: hypothetical protein HS115_17530 [Spirochaetales bacterium]|nr:hypothetical protein [Spirochaetales bacterium]
MKNLKSLPLLILLCLLATCNRKLEIASISGDYKADFSSKEEDRQLVQLLVNAFAAVDEKKMSHLISFVHPDMGLYVDLKSHRSLKDLEADIQNPDSFINIYFTSTEKLRKQTGDPGQKSVHDVLKNSRHVKIHFLVDQPDMVEADLDLVDNPEDNFRLNNPAFTRQNGEWYLYRLF